MMKRTNFKTSLGALLVLSAICAAPSNSARAADIQTPKTVTIAPSTFSYRGSGEFLREGHAVDGPLMNITSDEPLEIMAYQVQVGDYEQCVAEGACEKRLGQGRADPKLPVTGVSFRDATDYAIWLSEKTGQNWRLPTDKEWAHAAGSRLSDDALNVEATREDPSKRWLAEYNTYSDISTVIDPIVRPLGTFGKNENGVYDMSGNIWEWTNGCYIRTSLDANGKTTSAIDNCGVRMALGQHRAYISVFIQDAKGGGCAVGAPPEYLGFRLIREPKKGFVGTLMKQIGL